MVTVVGHHFITLIVYICVQHGGREASRRVGLSAAAETCFTVQMLFLLCKQDCQSSEVKHFDI